MIRIHINTASLQEYNPAIIITDPFGLWTQQYSHVKLCCPSCQTEIGNINQQGNSAHVVINEKESITIIE